MTKTVTLSNRVTLQYAEQGSVSGVPMVLLHGATDSWRSFEPVLERLPGTIHAFAITQRGHGASGKPDQGYGYADMAEDVRAFMDALELPAAVIVGHSMGSMVAQRLAVDHRERVAGLVLVGAFRTLYRHTAVQEVWDTVSALTDPIDPTFVRAFQESTITRSVPPEFLNMVVNESLCVPARVWRAIFREFLETPDFSPELKRFAGPALIVWGELDAYALREDQEALHRVITGSRLVSYADTGHAIHWEDPDRFVTDLVAFVYERRPQGGQQILPSSEAEPQARRSEAEPW
jgi:pimeloyl-ACP methyl ester carboxylesterase